MAALSRVLRVDAGEGEGGDLAWPSWSCLVWAWWGGNPACASPGPRRLVWARPDGSLCLASLREIGIGGGDEAQGSALPAPQHSKPMT